VLELLREEMRGWKNEASGEGNKWEGQSIALKAYSLFIARSCLTGVARSTLEMFESVKFSFPSSSLNSQCENNLKTRSYLGESALGYTKMGFRSIYEKSMLNCTFYARRFRIKSAKS
jgi:hypothetical protein